MNDGRLFKPVIIEKLAKVLPRINIPIEPVEPIGDIGSSDSDMFKPTKVSKRKLLPNITIQEIQMRGE